MSEIETKISEPAEPESQDAGWKGHHVYFMAMACLLLGAALGYLLRGSQSPVQTGTAMTAPPPQPSAATHGEMGNQPPTVEQMKQMGDKVAAPALQKLKTNPKDFKALNNAGKVYRATHQFKEAATYYEKALAIDPSNVAVRTDLASCLYYVGDADGALMQLDKALSYDPKFFGALLNTGIIKLKAKDDVPGAIRTWEKILKTDANPEQKQIAKNLIERAKQKSKVSEQAPKS